MRKKYFFGIGIVLLCLAILGIHSIFKPHQNVEGESPAASFSARDLFNEFQHDETAADKKWVGKVLEVKGVISSVSEAGKYESVNLAATSDGGVNCSFLKKDVDSSTGFIKGDSITIKGKCTGFLMDVNLVDCVIKK
jgi:tRNA_anti-like